MAEPLVLVEGVTKSFGREVVTKVLHGIDVELAGVNAGRSWRMPPMIDALDAAEPGVYELKGTGEFVENPDFAIMLTIRASRRH
mgnify:CR=1 FL=1